MSRVPFWALLLAACSGTPGELGQGTFYYECAGEADPYCDCDRQPGFCGPGTNQAIEQNLYQRIPPTIAVGAFFEIRFTAPGKNTTVVSASPAMLSNDGVLQALRSGEVAVFGMDGSWVLDFYHLRLAAPTGVRVDRVDEVRRSIGQLDLEPGQTAWLRAMPERSDEILYGSLPCTWSLSATTAVSLDAAPEDNLATVTALAPGTATVTVALGELDAAVAVTVADASSLRSARSGGAP